MTCNFHIGQKVVCIRHSEDFNCNCDRVPEFGQIYTIRQIEKNPANGEIFFLLEEIVNLPRDYADEYGEQCFHWSGFRPVVERKTDISVFTAMLKTSKDRVLA